MVWSSWGQRRQRVELWVTWGSQDWAWTPFLLLRALPSPSDKEETDVINEQGGRLEIRWARGIRLVGVRLEVQELPFGRGATESWASLSQDSQRHLLHEGLGAECVERSRLAAESEEKQSPRMAGPGCSWCDLGEESSGPRRRRRVREARGGSCTQSRPERCGYERPEAERREARQTRRKQLLLGVRVCDVAGSHISWRTSPPPLSGGSS